MERIKRFDLSLKSNSSNEILDIENIYLQTKDGNLFLNIKVNQSGVTKFVAGEQLQIFSTDGFSLIGINCPAIRFSVVKSGYGYSVGDRIDIPDNVINHGTVSVKSLTKGGIQEVAITEGGTGYKEGDYLYASRNSFNSGYGFYGYVSKVSNTGTVESVVITTPGDGFDYIPTISIYSKTGTDAVLSVTKHNIGGIKELEYRENYNIDLTRFKSDDIQPTVISKNGQDAELSFDYSAIGLTSAFHRTSEGFLNSTSYLTDSLYYQQFSYKINSNLPRYRYDKLADELLHPAGYIRYAGYTIADKKKRINLVKKVKFRKD